MRGFQEDVEQLQSAIEGMDGSMGELSYPPQLRFATEIVVFFQTRPLVKTKSLNCFERRRTRANI